MQKANRLLKLYDKFTLVTIISCTMYILIFFVFLLLSTPNPIFTLIVIASAFPSCLALCLLLYKIKKKLITNINNELTTMLKQEFAKEFATQNVPCVFMIKPSCYDAQHIATDFHFCYSDPDVKLYKTVIFTIAKVKNWINAFLPTLHHIYILPKIDPTLQSDVVV